LAQLAEQVVGEGHAFQRRTRFELAMQVGRYIADLNHDRHALSILTCGEHVNAFGERVVSAEGMQNWQRFISLTVVPNESRDADLIYRSGDTIAERFDVKMTPGTYYLIFNFGPVATGTTDHFGGGGAGPSYRQVRPKIRLDYELPCESCP